MKRRRDRSRPPDEGRDREASAGTPPVCGEDEHAADNLPWSFDVGLDARGGDCPLRSLPRPW